MEERPKAKEKASNGTCAVIGEVRCGIALSVVISICVLELCVLVLLVVIL